MKTLKFKNHLVPLVLSGEKDVTWRLFDDKDLQTGDELSLVNADSGEAFGTATITSVREKQLGAVEDSDYDGHERYASAKEILETFRTYYGGRVTSESILKIVQFQLHKE